MAKVLKQIEKLAQNLQTQFVFSTESLHLLLKILITTYCYIFLFEEHLRSIRSCVVSEKLTFIDYFYCRKNIPTYTLIKILLMY